MPVLTTLGAATAKAWGFLQQVAAAADPYFNYVTMLLTGNGTNGAQNNTFLDSSTNAFSITRNGNTTQGSFSPYGSLWSNYFNGSSTYLTTNASVPATGALTVEMWVYPTSASGYQLLFSQYTSGNSGNFQMLWNDTASKFTLNIGGGTVLTSSNTYATNTWYHLAITRDGSNNMTMWVNGASAATTTNSTSILQTTTYIGSRSALDGYFNGYISNLRVNNTAVYTSSFTPSTTPLTAISGTSLLTCQSNRFIDNSSNAFAITINGTPSVQRFSPFNPTASYDTATIGGSGYFDGSGDYLSLPNNSAFAIGTNDFTFETWAYFTATPNTQIFCTNDGYGTDSPYGYYYFSYESGAFWSWGGGGGGNTGVSASYTMPLNQWVHLVAVRSGTSHSIFVNGTRIGNATNQQSYAGGTAPLIGARVNYITGYLSDSRFVNGTAVYSPSSSTLTVPTAPLTAVTNTKLLASYTNAGIPDSAMMNDLETVGNAQVSTSVKKFGTGSLAFDGSGDILQFPASQYWNFSSGDWTIEGWLYPNTVSGGQILLENTTDGTGGLSIQMNGSAFLVYINSTAINAGTFTASTWQHFALVRSGSTMTAYINGSSVGTSSTTPGSGATGLWIGSRSGGSISLNGYIDDFRITKGYARYTSSFTPPTAAFPTY